MKHCTVQRKKRGAGSAGRRSRVLSAGWKQGRGLFLVALLSLMGTILVLFGLVYGIVEWVLSASTGQPATTGSVMIAVLPLILGFQMLLQALSMEVHSSPGAEETRDFSHMIVTGRAPGGTEVPKE